MRIIIKYGFLFLVIFSSVNTLNSQDISSVYIPLPRQELAVEGYLQLIEKNTEYILTYSSEIIESKTLKLNYDSMSVKSILDSIFTNITLKYLLKGNLLILSPQNDKASIKKAVRVTGIVLNSRTSKPVPFASVFVPQKSIGTISNYEGAFELYLPEALEIDTLMVSSIGFGISIITSTEFLVKPVEVFLKPNKYEITELIIRPENPQELLLKAVGEKKQNYNNEPILLTAFFREATKQNNSYISLSEAIIDIYKTSYNNENDDLVKLKKGRRGSNTEESELVNMVVEGGLYNSMQLDVVKYGVSFLDPEQMSNYEYIIDQQITYNERQTYVIKFKLKPGKNFVGFDGFVYLDAKSLAIVRVEFEISAFGLQYAREMMIKKAPSGFQVKPKYGKYEVEYRMYDNCWNLMHGRSDIGVKVKKNRGSKNKGYTCQFTSSSEFVVTGQETDGFERIKYKEASKPRDILYEQISSTDMEFWDNETTILPEEPLLKTIEKLKLIERTEKTKLTSNKPPEK